MCCLNKNLFLIGAVLGMRLTAWAVIGISDDFDSDTTASWISVGVTNTTIGYDAISTEDYDDGDPSQKISYSAGMLLTGDGVKDDGGLRFNTQDAVSGSEAIALTIAGAMEEDEELTFTGSVYNDNPSYSDFNAQLWNLTDNTMLAESGNITVERSGHDAYVPVSFNVSCTASASDASDVLQIRFVEGNNNAARDIYIDNFDLTTSLGPPPVYNHPRLFFSTNELAEIQARRFTTHSDEWAQLIAVCNGVNGDPAPADPRNDPNILGEEDKLVAMALAQLIDPTLPYYETSTNWFFTMLNWNEWGVTNELGESNWAWPDYGPNGNLGTAENLKALAVWYDLQYHTLTPAQQVDASQKLADYADRFRNSYSRFWTTDNGELTGNHCWAAFSSLAAVYYASDHVSPSRQSDWASLLNGHYATIKNLMNTVMSDGSTGEGLTYWTYGIEKVLHWFEMRRVAGDPAFDGIDWFKNTGTYGLFGIMPGGTDNYGGITRYDDADKDFWGNPYNEISLLAKATQDPVAQWMANELDYTGADKKNAYRYIFYDAELPSADLETVNNWHFFDNYGFFFWRDSWADNAQHFTLRSGQHSHGHSKGDDGQFMLARDGVPYIVDLGYSRPRYTKDSNVLLVDGTGQLSDGELYGTVFNNSWPANSNTWGQTKHVLASDAYYQKGDFFNVLVDPAPMYTNAALSSWNREAVGLGGDLYLMHDTVSAGTSVEFSLSLHGLATSAYGDTYSIAAMSNPWSTTGAGKWSLDPRSGKPVLKVEDLSKDTWSAAIEETWYDDKAEAVNVIRQGNQLVRKLTGTEGSSLISFGFDDLLSGWTQSSWTNATAEGVHVTSNGAPVIDVLWPLNGVSVSGSDSWTVTGKMAGRRFGDSFFGRDVTAVQYNGQELLSASTPVSFHAKTEFPLGGTVPNRITISAEAPSTVTLYSPHEPKSVQLDGTDIGFSWTNDLVTFYILASDQSTIDLVDASYLAWRDLHFSGAEIDTGLSGLDEDPDTDNRSNWEEFVADTNPRDINSYWAMTANNGTFSFGSSTACLYAVDFSTNLVGGVWQPLIEDQPGTGSDMPVSDTNDYENCFYRARVERP